MNVISRFFDGMKIPFQGFQVYRKHKSLKFISIAPALISLFVIVLGGSMGWKLVNIAMLKLSEVLSVSMEGFILWIVTAFFFLVYIALLIIALMIISNLLAIPFNALIAERTMVKLNSDIYMPKTKKEWLVFSLQMLITGLAKALLFVCIGLSLFFFSFIPILSLVAAYFAMILLAYDCCDYGLELKAFGFKDRMAFLKRKFPELAGFAAILSITFILPGINFFLLPIFVVSGCCMVAHEPKKLESSKITQ